MTIDPRWGMWLSIATAILSYLTGAGALLTDLFGADHAKIILGIFSLTLGIISSLNAVLHAIPSKPGAIDEFPLGPKKP